ncbi:MAG: peroxiredoxin [Thalassovita sp.]
MNRPPKPIPAPIPSPRQAPRGRCEAHGVWSALVFGRPRLGPSPTLLLCCLCAQWVYSLPCHAITNANHKTDGRGLTVTDLTPAPDFTLPQDGGDPVTLSALRPAPVVLFFYPRDNTSGCTREAKEFTEFQKEFQDLGVKVFGVSKDTIASHEKFRTKQDLGIALLSDAETTVCEDYGVWKEKSMYGKTFWGIVRSTFLIDAEGNIAQEWRKVKVPNHVQEVLAAAKALGS